MAKLSKRMEHMLSQIEKEKVYGVLDAIDLLKSFTKVKFDETLDIAINLGVDPKYSDQIVRGVASLPYGSGKSSSVAVFTKDEKAEEAKRAGADIVGSEDLVEKIEKGEINFDRCIATPDMMGLVGRVAKILGPKGLMPNPKLGTVTIDVKKAIEDAKAGQIEFRADKFGIVHAGIGKLSFEANALFENVKYLVDIINKSKPSGAKGVFMKTISLSSTMGPSLKVDLLSLV